MENQPYIFFRFSDSVRALNMQTKRFVSLMKMNLSPAMPQYPMGSSLFVYRKDDQNPSSNYNLFTMGEFANQNLSICTKLLKLHFDNAYLSTKELE